MGNRVFKGTLRQINSKAFIESSGGKRYLEDELIWSGYARHWKGRKVFARHLEEKDYENNRPIVIVWPDIPSPIEPFVELYYNERLVKYRASVFGHIAINVNGEIFNFSHKINENEIVAPEEYFYRPPLGGFAPHPETGRFNVDNSGKPYYDKFGRNFMRTIHVLHIEGLDTGRLTDFFNKKLDGVYNAPVDPEDPEKYSEFSVVANSCTTIIRDGFREYGFRNIAGFFPRDLFINAVYHFTKKENDRSVGTELFRMKQLKVPEADYSAMTPIINPVNYFKQMRLPDY